MPALGLQSHTLFLTSFLQPVAQDFCRSTFSSQGGLLSILVSRCKHCILLCFLFLALLPFTESMLPPVRAVQSCIIAGLPKLSGQVLSQQLSAPSGSKPKRSLSQDTRNSHKRRQVLPKGSRHPGILRIATWNVQGASPSKMPGMYNALEEHGIDVCILTETKWTFATGDGHVLDKRWSAARVD